MLPPLLLLLFGRVCFVVVMLPVVGLLWGCVASVAVAGRLAVLSLVRLAVWLLFGLPIPFVVAAVVAGLPLLLLRLLSLAKPGHSANQRKLNRRGPSRLRRGPAEVQVRLVYLVARREAVGWVFIIWLLLVWLFLVVAAAVWLYVA